MKTLLCSVALVALMMAAPAQAADLTELHSFDGIAWDGGKAATVSHLAPIAGLHFAPDGRAFVSVPRWISADVSATLNLLVDDGSGVARLTPFPELVAQSLTASPADSLRNVLGFHVDTTNGWLWALD
ncbi:hypothetical protein, partial [Cypionkella sp.]|uniref:hypothetical protein n=1 Tax=Cypionkella sp. TaxID=2811411 RepID=UPI002AB8B489